jgi:adenosylhomocysteine nucleosidase
MTRTAIIAALAGELKPLVRGWTHEHRHGVDLWRKRQGEREWIAACAGIGPAAAGRAFAEVEREGKIDRVVSTGWAGALSADFAPGEAYWVGRVIAADTGEIIDARFAPPPKCWLVTHDRVANADEKRRLAAAHGAHLVDMEAVAIARLAAMRGVAFSCVKGVSDGCADRLPDFNRFISPQGRFEPVRFVLSVLFRPGRWAALIRLGKNSRQSAQAIKTKILFEDFSKEN